MRTLLAIACMTLLSLALTGCKTQDIPPENAPGGSLPHAVDATGKPYVQLSPVMDPEQVSSRRTSTTARPTNTPDDTPDDE